MSKELGPLKLGDMRITLDDIQKGMLLWKFHVDKDLSSKEEQKDESLETKDITGEIDEPTTILEEQAEDPTLTVKATVKDAATTTTPTEATYTKSGPDRAISVDPSDIATDASLKPNAEEDRPKLPHAKPFIKIMLRKTNEILLYEQRSETVPRDSDEGRAVVADNELYEDLTNGAGSNNRRTRHSVTQTRQILRKCREVNTETIRQQQQASYVSNFEMFDTYRDLEQTTQSMDLNGGDGSAAQKFEVTTYKVDGVDTFVAINRSDAFHLALMMALRILAGNVYEQQQRRFRNMLMPDPLALQVQYKYRLELMWRFAAQNVPDEDSADSAELPDEDEDDEDSGPPSYAVADMSWCLTHGDILAVAYGSYSYGEVGRKAPQRGHVCVWSIKNPVNPERLYKFEAPVVSVEFCPTMPQLLAVGLYDGSVQIVDITRIQKACAAVSQRSANTRLCFEPITALAWLNVNEAVDDPEKMQALLALSQDGSVTKYRIITSPYLLAYPLVALQRCDGHIEGISKMALSENVPAGSTSRPLQVKANNNVQGLDLCLHPLSTDIYHVLSDEGCIYRCSTNYPQQHLAVFQAHEAGINVMAYSPWSPKLFLTCGNDWCIRVWLEGIFEPIMTLQNGIGPVHWAAWSETHSTVLVSVSRHSIDVWDFRRSTLKPMSSTTFDKVCNTTAKFSLCGRSLAVGKEDGSIMMVAFEDMPFPPYFQYDQLEQSIHEAIAVNEPLLRKPQMTTLSSNGHLIVAQPPLPLLMPERQLLRNFPAPYNEQMSPYADVKNFSKMTCAELMRRSIKMRPCKVIFVGDVAVGKTTMVHRFCYDKFQTSYKATIGVDFEIENFNILGQSFCLEIWDTAGQERFKCIAQAYYRNANVIVVVFDMTNLQTLHSCTKWLKSSLAVNSQQKPLIFLVGTKSDLMSFDEFRRVEKLAAEMADAIKAEYWSISARTGYNVVEFFQRMAALAFESTFTMATIERRIQQRDHSISQQMQKKSKQFADFHNLCSDKKKPQMRSYCAC